jgi:hypothetical protein
MRLSRWSSISLIAIAVSLTACTDTLDPNTIPGVFYLHDINGRLLPTSQATTPGLTLTVKSAGLSLDFSGPAQLVQTVTQLNGTDATITSNYTYRLNGHELIFELSPPCPINATCASPPTGRMPSENFVDLEIGRIDNVPIVYHFQRQTIAY